MDEADFERRLSVMEQQLLHGALRMDTLEKSLKDNTELTTEIRDILRATRLGFKAIGAIGAAIKWAGPVAASLGGWYVTAKANHWWPFP